MQRQLLSPQDQQILAAEALSRSFENGRKMPGSAKNLEDDIVDDEPQNFDFNWDKMSFTKEYNEILDKMPEKSFFQKLIKGFNYICSVSMFITAIYRFATYDAVKIKMDGFYLAFTIYLFVFGGLLIAAEYQYIKILQYIEFLASQRGKGFFMIWIGILLFDPQKQVDLWSSLSLTIVGIFNIILSCMKDKPNFQNPESSKPSGNVNYVQYQALLDDAESEPLVEDNSNNNAKNENLSNFENQNV